MASVQFNSEQFKARVFDACNRGLTSAAITLSGHMRSGMSKGSRFSSSPPGSPPNVQRGGLRRGITHTPGVNLRSSAGASASIPYAMIQERGGTIRPRNSKYLPVPINIAAKRLLELHGMRTQTLGGGSGFVRTGGLRRLNLQFIRSKSGQAMLVGRRPKSVRWSVGGGGFLGVRELPAFVLKRSIRIPPRPWAVPALTRNKANIYASFHRVASRAIGQAITGGIR